MRTLKDFVQLPVLFGSFVMVAVLVAGATHRTPGASKNYPMLADEGAMPELDGAIGWLNSAPLNRK
jgi:hypothetical protein